MTVTSITATKTPLTLGITFDGYDYRVPAPDGREEAAYYTDNIEDAALTARHMYKHICQNLELVCTEVDNHPT